MQRIKTSYIFTIISAIALIFTSVMVNLAIAQNNTANTKEDIDAAQPIEKKIDLPTIDLPTVEKPAIVQSTMTNTKEDIGAAQPVEKKIDLPTADLPIVEKPAIVQNDSTNKKEDIDVAQPVEKKIDLPTVETPEEIYQLKKLDPNKIGVGTSYETFGGVRVPEKILKSPSIGFGQRVEIYQEPKPIDAYMIMAKEMQYVWSDFHRMRQNLVQQTPANLRSIVVPLFVRSYGTEVTISDYNESSHDIKGQIRYTLDYRDVYREYYPKYPDLKQANWLQQDIMFITMAKIEPLGWVYTSNVGYRYSNIDQKSYDSRWNFGSAQQMRSTYYVNQSIAPSPRLEIFGQGEYFKANYYHNDWAYTPDHYFIAGELRLKSKDMKTSYTGRFSYSIDIYSPVSNTFEKYEIWARVGHDFNDRLNAYTMLKYAYGHTRSEDNAWWQVIPGGGWWQTKAYPGPFDVTALAITWENRAQYRVYDKLWVQGGADMATGINMSDFDNLGMLVGLEYYAPGIIRVDVGWRGNLYYNIDDTLSTLYFKVYLFM